MENEMTPREVSVSLARNIISNDLCIGCGACVARPNAESAMQFDEFGMLKPVLDVSEPDAWGLSVCPFSDQSLNEDQIAESLWPHLAHDIRIGRYSDLYAGQIKDQQDRLDGSSGGLTTWILRSLLQHNLIDAVAHVKPVQPTADSLQRLFRYDISSNEEELNAGRGSRYYPIEVSEIVRQIRQRPGRYAVVAIPCVAKALRNIMHQDPILNQRIKFVVGLVCGHLKSRYFADFIADTQGIRSGEYDTVNFRHKLPGRPASDYGVSVHLKGRVVSSSRPLRDYFATSWEIGAFRNPACDFCDDVFAETADVVLGDAWMDPYDQSWLGSNVILTRDPAIHVILEQGAAAGEIELTKISPDDISKSQAGGLRHRREGLAHRLQRRAAEGKWFPNKRFGLSNTAVSAQRSGLYDRRSALTLASHRAFRLARTLRSMAIFKLLFAFPVFSYYRAVGGLRRAASQSTPGRWLRRALSRS